MSFTVTIQPSGHVLSAEAHETILDAALRQGLLIPYGCRDGACGACRGRVLEGEFEHGIKQDHVITAADRDQGYALFCCAKPKSDLVIESREVKKIGEIPIKTVPARVQSMVRAAADVMILKLKLPTSERLQFIAGQYVDILLKDGRRRSFSLANAPHDDDLLELHIRLIAGGEFTGHVFSAMKEKEILRLNGPHGSFYFREDSTKPIIMVAGGTGFAPIKALVEHAIAEKCLRPISVYWGARTRADLYALPVADSWTAQPNICFIPVLSDASEHDAWNGRTGLVHEAVVTDFPDLSKHQVYACGSPAMIAAVKQNFYNQCKLLETEFFADSFDFANDKV